MTTRVLISVDTELTWRAHLAGCGWEENLRRSYEAAGVGVSYQLGRLARHGLRACYFVDPMPAVMFGIEPVRRMIAPIVAAGQEVQLHLHPMWLDALSRRVDDTADHDMRGRRVEEQHAIMARAIALFREAGGGDPVAFRAGNYGADDATLAAAAAVGMRYDTTHNGSMLPEPCAIGLPRAAVAPTMRQGLTELPVTLIDGGRGRLRHLQIGAVSFGEMRAALLHAEREGNPLVTIVGHSFELASRDGSRVNRLVRRRFDRLCAFLAAERDRFPTVRLDRLDALPMDVPATPAPTGAARRWVRMAAQAASNLVYEGRP
ncbi:polysaccharide deacetylase [Sphingomonas sp.]|uniref:polysaccharide deacetylase n=1 Tax=Sphingomonas sp. TaxID=28214 RepID=UPI003B000C10